MFPRLFGAVSVAGLVCLAGCNPPATDYNNDDDDERAPLPPLPDFVDDCREDANDTVEDAAGLIAENRQTYEGIELCDNDRDYYRIDVPPQRWISVEMTIYGLGNSFDGTDFDMWEVDEDGDRLWASASDRLKYERLAFYNPTDEPVAHYLLIEGSETDGVYDLIVRRTRFHEGVDCDDLLGDEDPDDESGPCNRIMQFPQMNDASEGLFVEHPPYWSNLRREIIYLVRYAAQATAAEFSDTNPLATLDMSERDGSTPGTSQGRLRHPEGTHVNGNDIDIAYYQTGENNNGREVCRNDGYFCTSDPDILDVARTAYFTARLFDNPHVRVIGMDTRVIGMLQDEAWDLVDDGILSERDAQILNGNGIAYGDGWPFHHHHMHFSWTWESGRERSVPPEGCMTEQHALSAFPPSP
jgi:hypothetical protein